MVSLALSVAGACAAGGQAGELPKYVARGVLRPKAEAIISTELPARVTKIGFKEGESFKEGEALIAFDCRRQEADLASVEAQEREAKVALDSAMVLEKRNAGNRNDTEIARARADKAHAEAASIRIRLSQCTISAPYDGYVTGLDIHEHEFSASGKPMLSIISSGETAIELIVPSLWLGWLKAGEAFEFTVDETQASYQAEVVRVGAAVDALSQTVKVFARFSEPAAGVRPGMSGAAHFKHGEG